MSVSAVVNDGVITNGSSKTSTSSSTSGTTNSIAAQKDQFMQLLVAQMKYQDPLEPTSNTEYIQQYATFSELEQMQNMSQNISLSRASDLVGKTVIVNTKDSSGNTVQVEGKVDYVTYSSGEAYVNISGDSYSADDVYAVVDSTYKDQIDAAQAIVDEIDKLGSLQEITLSDADSINNINTVYSALTTATKAYIPSKYVTALEQYVARIAELKAEAAAASSSSSTSTTGTSTGTTTGTTGTTGTTTGTTSDTTTDTATTTSTTET